MSTVIADTRAARKAEQRRKAAARARSYRERKREARAPAPRDVDSAITEAMSFHIARDGAGAGVNIGIVPLMRTARFVLEREGYSPQASASAIADRLSHRVEHVDPHHVPSLRPGPADRMRETKAGPWKTDMGVILHHLAGS